MPVIKIRRGTTTQWTASNRVLQLGELGLDTTLNKLKAGNGTTAWSSLPFLQADADVTELAQDAVATALANGTHSNITVTYSDNDNSISLATGPDVITQTSLSNTLTDATTGYVPIGDVGSADGVASLDSNGKIPDSEIPDTIARDTEIPSNTDSLSEGTTNKYFTDERAQDAVGNSVGDGLSYNDTTGAISVDTSTIATQSYVGTAVSNLVDAAPTTLNTLNELAAALGDDANYASTVSTALGLKAPLANPTFTGTVAGVTSTHVGLGNVDNTSDANKPVSNATQTALDLKSNLITTINAQSSGYTLATSDSGKLIEMSNGGTLTITDSSSFAVGFTCDILQTGSSQVTIAGNGFTPNATPGLKLRAQWSSASLVKRALNSWVVMGDLST
jgi:hypothetical protein